MSTWMRRAGFVSLTVMLGPAGARATVFFENAGTTSGWSSTPSGEHNGSVAQVTSPTFKGSTALRSRQVFDSSYTGRYHAEAMVSSIGQQGQDRYYGYTYRLMDNWQFVSQNFNFSQFGATFPNTSCGGTINKPTTMNWLLGTTLRTRVKFGTVCAPVTTEYVVTSSLTAGVWHRLVQRIRFASNNTGLFQTWLDGTLVVNQSNLATTVAENPPFRWSVGLYANGWHDDGNVMVGSQGTRDVYHDHYRIASSFAEADPDAWGGGATPTPTPVTPTPTAMTPTPTAMTPTPTAMTPTPTPTATATPTATPTPGGGFSGYYRIMARHSGKAVVVQGASTSNSANVFQWTYGGSATNDEWRVLDIGAGYYRVINRNSGKDLVVQSASTSEGANIFQYTYGGAATNDEWAIVDVGAGYFRITNRNSGKSAEVAGGGTADGANVDQRTYSGAAYQQFQLVPLP
jgi:hypothetical protein